MSVEEQENLRFGLPAENWRPDVEPAEDLWDWRDKYACDSTERQMLMSLVGRTEADEAILQFDGIIGRSRDETTSGTHDILAMGCGWLQELSREYDPQIEARRKRDGYPEMETKSKVKRPSTRGLKQNDVVEVNGP